MKVTLLYGGLSALLVTLLGVNVSLNRLFKKLFAGAELPKPLLMKVRVRDIESLQQLLLHQLNGMDGVRQTRTIMVLSTVKEECFVPTAARGETT